MRDLIDREALLTRLRQLRDGAVAGGKRNPEDPEWDTIADCYDDAIRTALEAERVD